MEIILGERIDMQTIDDKKSNDAGERISRTMSGRELTADLIVCYLCSLYLLAFSYPSSQLICTGQKPNTGIIGSLDPTLLVSDGRARVKRTLQLDSPDYPHIFAVGDSADAFGAISSGRNADFQVRLRIH